MAASMLRAGMTTERKPRRQGGGRRFPLIFMRLHRECLKGSRGRTSCNIQWEPQSTGTVRGWRRMFLENDFGRPRACGFDDPCGAGRDAATAPEAGDCAFRGQNACKIAP